MIGQPWCGAPHAVGVRHAHAVVEGLVGVAAVHGVQRADREALRRGRQDEERDALVLLGIRIRARSDPDVRRHVRQRRPDLLAVDHPLVADLHRAGAQRGEVAAGVGLAVGQREAELAAADAGQVAALLVLAAETRECRADRRVREVAVGHAPVLHLLDEQELEQRVAGRVALHREALVQEAAFGQRRAEAAQLRTVGAVAARVLFEQLRRAELADEGAHALAERELLGHPLVVHAAQATTTPPTRW